MNLLTCIWQKVEMLKTEQERRQQQLNILSKAAIKTTAENAAVLFSLQHKISLLKYAVS